MNWHKSTLFAYAWPSKHSGWYIEARQEVARPPLPYRQGHVVLCVWLGISWPARPLISHIATLSVFPLPHQLMGRALLQCALLWKAETSVPHTKLNCEFRLLSRVMNEPPMFIFSFNMLTISRFQICVCEFESLDFTELDNWIEWWDFR